MPAISMFYGILIRMFFRDTDKHHLPHAWIEIHQEDLLADWELVANGKTPFSIKGLDQ